MLPYREYNDPTNVDFTKYGKTGGLSEHNFFRNNERQGTLPGAEPPIPNNGRPIGALPGIGEGEFRDAGARGGADETDSTAPGHETFAGHADTQTGPYSEVTGFEANNHNIGNMVDGVMGAASFAASPMVGMGKLGLEMAGYDVPSVFPDVETLLDSLLGGPEQVDDPNNALGWGPGNLADEQSNATAYDDVDVGAATEAAGIENDTATDAHGVGTDTDASTSTASGSTDTQGAVGSESASSQADNNDPEAGIDEGDPSVICDFLYTQGLLDTDINAHDQAYGKTLSVTVVAGYHVWAKPFVRSMKRHYWVMMFGALLGRSWAKEVAYQAGMDIKRPKLGRFLHWAGVPVCRFIGKHIVLRRSRKMTHGYI